MKKHRHGYLLVQIYSAKIKILLYSVWCNRVLSIHNWKDLRRCHSICLQHMDIAVEDLRIIKHCRKYLLYHENKAWKKKKSESFFDVTMGSNDAAEICELTGIYILSQLSNLVPREDSGLCRDDVLILRRNTNGQLTDRVRKM